MPPGRPVARKRFRVGERNRREWLDPLEVFEIGRPGKELESFVADRMALAANEEVPVIIEHLLEGPFVNHRLVSLETGALLPFERFQRHCAKLDSLNRAPWR